MDNLESMSDDELRLRLRMNGFPNLPITLTTRKTLIKKLRNHLANNANSLRKTTSIVTQFSSGEESDATDTNNKNTAIVKAKRTRMTISGIQGGKEEMPPPFSVSSSPVLSIFNRSSIGKKSSVYVSPVIIDSEDDEIDWSISKSRSTDIPRGNVNQHATESYNSNGTNSKFLSENEDYSNATNDYTTRLLQFREGNFHRQHSIHKRIQQPASLFNENDIVTHAEPSPEPVHIPLIMAVKNFINRLDAAYGFKQTFVPMVLLTTFIIFFVLLVVGYTTISPDIESSLTAERTLYVACNNHNMEASSYTCIEENSLETSLKLLKILAQFLHHRSVAQKCGEPNLDGSLSHILCVKGFLNHLSEEQYQLKATVDVITVMKDLHNIEYLIDRNKEWGISNVDGIGEVLSMEQVIERRSHQAECFAILKPKLPTLCTLKNKLHTFFIIIGTISIISLIVFVIRKFYFFVLQVKEKRKALVNRLIGDIISSLMEKSVPDKENAVVIIAHLRDKLIEPGRRSELRWAWKEALTYLEHNDSRVQFEYTNVKGEDLKVIRWIDDTKNLSSSSNNMQTPQLQRCSSTAFASNARVLKKWMCPAFDKSNKIKDPPTNCLKIRQMFDKYEANNSNLQIIIQDTILHKLASTNCKIYDIRIEPKSCCVYCKCATNSDAGIVHGEINGWWLSGRLVVVKFLKLDKYHQRFPDSIKANTIMHPSSNIYVTSATGSYEDNEASENDE